MAVYLFQRKRALIESIRSNVYSRPVFVEHVIIPTDFLVRFLKVSGTKSQTDGLRIYRDVARYYITSIIIVFQ